MTGSVKVSDQSQGFQHQWMHIILLKKKEEIDGGQNEQFYHNIAQLISSLLKSFLVFMISSLTELLLV